LRKQYWYLGGDKVNDLLEAKLTIARIKTQILDLTGELISDDSAGKDYAIKRLLGVVE
jgi:hypothetical protein